MEVPDSVLSFWFATKHSRNRDGSFLQKRSGDCGIDEHSLCVLEDSTCDVLSNGKDFRLNCSATTIYWTDSESFLRMREAGHYGLVTVSN